MTFAEPGWLLALLLLPLLVTAAVLVARSRSMQWSAFVAPRLRPRLLHRSSPLPRWVAFACLVVSLACLILSMARPQSTHGTRSEAILGRNILFALDLSRSMKVADVKPDRLSQAKAACFELLDALPNDRVGLVGFAGTPYLFAPLTVDHAAVRESLAEIDLDWIPTGGSNLAGGMQLGIETLQATGTRQNALILLTDGEETSGEIIEMAETARAAGIEVITIGFGTEEGDFVLDPSFEDGRYRNRDNQTVISRLEPAALERVASITGGRFAIATNGADLPAMVEAAVADLDRVQLAGRETRIVHEYYQWLLLPSILFMFGSIVTATRWRGHSQTIAPLSRTALILLILGFSFISPEAAQATLFEEARKAMRDHRYDEAVGAYERLATEHEDQEEGFRFSLAQGSAAYKNEDWPTARAAFSNALRSESAEVRDAAHHGLGNTLFQIGWQRLSGGPAYPEIPQPEADQEEGEPPNGMQRLSDALLNMPDDLEQPDADDLMGRFEIMVKLRLSEWMTEDSVGEGQSRGSQRFNDLLTDWIDAIRHHDNATGLEAAAHNRQLTWEYLEKIREILDQTRERAEQVQAIPQSGEGEPQPQPNGQEGEEGNDPNENGSGSGDESEEGGEGGDERDRGQEPRDGESQESDRDPTDNQPKPGETPEEAARRLLKENADLQKGALTPGRRRFRQPEKDW